MDIFRWAQLKEYFGEQQLPNRPNGKCSCDLCDPNVTKQLSNNSQIQEVEMAAVFKVSAHGIILSLL